MKVFTGLVFGIGLALSVPSVAQAATMNLAFPSHNPDARYVHDRCKSFLGLGGSHCTDRFTFTLTDASNISIQIMNVGAFKSYDWSLSGTSLTGAGGPIDGISTIADLKSIALGAGTYTFKLKLKKGEGTYSFLIALDLPIADPPIEIATSTQTDPPAQTPLPASWLLFASGAAALLFAGRRRAAAKCALASDN